MKKYMVLCAGLAVALAFTSCKSSESAYRKAYEKAKAQETNTVVEQPSNAGSETTVVAPVVTRPSTETMMHRLFTTVPATCIAWWLLPTTIRPVPCAAATTSRPVSIPMLGCSITSSKPKCREYFQ